MKSLFFVIVSIAVITGTVLATSYGRPQKKTVTSSNGMFLLVVDPQTQEHAVFAAADSKKKRWSFQKPVWRHDYLVSDDGKRVCVVKWKWVQTRELKSDAISIWTEKGEESQISYKKFGKRRRKSLGESGPIGLFWRVWRDSVSSKNNIVSITSTIKGKRKMVIDLSSGKLN